VVTNRQFKDDVYFIRCCQGANIKPTKRQASKFRRGKGLAFKFKVGILK